MSKMTLRFTTTLQFILIIMVSICALNAFAYVKKKPLPIEQAFQVALIQHDEQQFIQLNIADGYYLYRDRLSIHIEPTSSANNPDTRIAYPKAHTKQDSSGEAVAIYTGKLEIALPKDVTAKTADQVVVDYQGCSAQGFCYPPQHQTFNLIATAATATAASATTVIPVSQAPNDIANTAKPAASIKSLLTDQHGIQNILQSQNYAIIMLLFLGLGLLLAFTPCVLPMVPILTGIIIGQKEISTRKAFILSLIYVLGTALTYAVAGVAAAMMGNSLQVWLQRPSVIVFVSLIFVFLALSLFGLFELRLPSRMQTRMVNLTNSFQGGTYVGVFGMGVLSTLIVSPCVTAPLMGVLLYISQTGDLFLGALSLFAIGVGMGLPLLLIGTTAGKWLPKAGAWMELIKKLFGVLMLIMAIWLLSRTMTLQTADILWKICLLGIFFAIGGYLPRIVGYRRFHRGVGVCAGCFSMLLMLGGVNFPNPIIKSGFVHQTEDQTFYIVRDIDDMRTQLTQAQSLHKPVILDFYADWCDSCVSMDKKVFSKPHVQQALANYVLLRADLTANNEQAESLLKYFSVIAPPTILFFDDKGKELDQARIVGEVDAKEFLARLNNA